MRITYLIYVILILTFSYHSKAQIIAGSVSVFDTYFDIIPDSCLEASPTHLSILHGEMNIDIDGNGLNDFHIISSGGGGLGGGGAGASIMAVNSSAWIVAFDTLVMGYPPGILYNATIVEPIDSGIVIGPGMALKTSGVFFRVNYGAASGGATNYWTNIGEHFIGVALTYSSDTIYGWIRAELINSSYYILEIKDYACEINTSGISYPLNEQKIILYPNPAKDYLQVQIDLENNNFHQFCIYDNTGRIVKNMNSQIQNNIFNINVRKLVPGIYFLNLVTDKKVYRIKFIKE